jgi:hypothetical protein
MDCLVEKPAKPISRLKDNYEDAEDIYNNW